MRGNSLIGMDKRLFVFVDMQSFFVCRCVVFLFWEREKSVFLGGIHNVSVYWRG